MYTCGCIYMFSILGQLKCLSFSITLAVQIFLCWHFNKCSYTTKLVLFFSLGKKQSSEALGRKLHQYEVLILDDGIIVFMHSIKEFIPSQVFLEIIVLLLYYFHFRQHLIEFIPSRIVPEIISVPLYFNIR